jgi:hypothetical protein
MELLKQLLAAEKINVPNLEKELKALGYSGELTDDKAQEAFEKLKAKFGSKLAKNKGTIAPESAIDAVADAAALRVKSMVQNAESFAARTAEKNATKIIEIVQSIPDLTLARVRQLASEADDLGFFRGEIEDFETAFAAKFDFE